MNQDDLHRLAVRFADEGRAHALVTVIRAVAPTSAFVGAQALVAADGSVHGWVGGGCALGAVRQAARAAIDAGEPRLIRVSNDASAADADVELFAMPCASNGTIELFIQPSVPAPLLLVLGATPAALEACALARRMGLRVAAAATSPLPAADLVAHLDGYDVAAIDALRPRFALVATQGDGDEAALAAALTSCADAVLLIASRRKAERLVSLMRARGIDEARLTRLQAPAGPDIRARTPEEIALAAIAAVVALRRGGAADTPAASTAAMMAAAPGEAPPAGPDDYVNPVCNRVIAREGALHVIDFAGQRHYFCCDGCKTEFERDPDKYAAIFARQAA